jgi:hypothetical protein
MEHGRYVMVKMRKIIKERGAITATIAVVGALALALLSGCATSGGGDGRSFEADGIVVRKIYAEVPPRVEYSLSELGDSLRPIIEVMEKRGKAYKARIEKKGVTIRPPLLNGTNPPPEWGLGGILPPGEGVAVDACGRSVGEPSPC